MATKKSKVTPKLKLHTYAPFKDEKPKVKKKTLLEKYAESANERFSFVAGRFRAHDTRIEDVEKTIKQFATLIGSTRGDVDNLNKHCLTTAQAGAMFQKIDDYHAEKRHEVIMLRLKNLEYNPSSPKPEVFEAMRNAVNGILVRVDGLEEKQAAIPNRLINLNCLYMDGQRKIFFCEDPEEARKIIANSSAWEWIKASIRRIFT